MIYYEELVVALLTVCEEDVPERLERPRRYSCTCPRRAYVIGAQDGGSCRL